LKNWKLNKIATLDGGSPTLTDRSSYAHRTDIGAEIKAPDCPDRLQGTFYRKPTAEIEGCIWRSLLSLEDWKDLGGKGLLLQLYNTVNGESLTVEVTRSCVRRHKRRIEVEVISGAEKAAECVPVRKLRTVRCKAA
jgi:hypothetical protein